MKKLNCISMPKSIKTLLALTPSDKCDGLKAIFIGAIETEMKAQLMSRKSKDKTEDK